MNQKFIKNIFIPSLLIGGLLASTLPANAAGFNKDKNNNGTTMSSTKFYEVLAKTKMDQLGHNFGMPDEIQALKDTSGNRVGLVWVYHDAVKKENSMQDAHFVIINGELQYATLSNAS
jgi:hypothetical protein